MAPRQKNHTLSSECIMLGFGDLAELQMFSFGLLLITHLVTLAGHTTSALTTDPDSCLRTPMCFFLRNLSTVEICCVSLIVPKMLADFLSSGQRMPTRGCAWQTQLFIALGGAECLLRAVMACDRFAAICNPLRYALAVARALCLQVRALACVSGYALSLALTTLLLPLPFCRSQGINRGFRDIPAVPFLACSGTRASEIAVSPLCTLTRLVPFLPIPLSCGFVIAAVLRVHSAEGRSNAFSTRAGHLLVSLLHLGRAIFTYLRPRSRHTPERDKTVSLIYTSVAPMLYPMTYM